MRFLSNLPAILFVFYVVLLSPFLAWRKSRKRTSGRPLTSKLRRTRFTVLYLFALTLFAVVAALASHIHIPLRVSIYDVIVIVGVGGCWGYFGARGIRRRSQAKMQRTRILYAPTTPQELRWALLSGVCAGIGEEIIYRGVLFALLLRFTSSLIIAVLICVVAFGLSHLAQGKKAAIVVGYIGLMFHVLFLLRHTLAVPIGIHMIYDLVILSTWYGVEKNLAVQAAKSQAVGQSA